MKKIFLLFFCLITYHVSSYAQTETKRDSIIINPENGLAESVEQIEHESDQELNENRTLDPEELRRRADFVRKMQFATPQFYVGSPIENKTLGEKLPHTNDYAFWSYSSLGNDFSISTVSRHDTYMTIGANRIVNAYLNYQATDWLEISGGIYGAKYNAYGQHFGDAGFNASIRLKLHDRIYLRGHGLYSINSDSRRFLGPAAMGMYPQSYFGGGVEFKVNENFGVEGGVRRELDPTTGNWTNTPYVAPVFYMLRGRRR